ncbi:MAG TPA: ATP-binding protein [Desulfobacteraceae bacterium]|nr:ATP-binding protein [Desulfobacteraceae bacterium]
MVPINAGARIVKVGVYENPPKVFTEESGKAAGIFIEILEAIAVEEQWELEYVGGSWGEGLERLKQGRIDIMPDVAYSAERETIFTYHDEPVLSDWFQVYAPKESGIKSIVDLAGKSIAVLERSVQQDAFTHLTEKFGFDSTILPLPDYKTIFQQVSQGIADAAITNRFYGLVHSQEFVLDDTAIIFNPTKLFFAFPKTIDPLVVKAIDAHMVPMKEEPQSIYYESLKRWTSEKVSFALPVWVKIVGVAAATVLLTSVIGIIMFRIQLHRRTLELQEINQENQRLVGKLEQKMLQLEEEVDTRRQAEKELRETSAFLNSIIENMPDMIFLKDAEELRFIRFNKAGEDLLGFSRDDLIGKSDHDFFAKEHADLFTKKDREVLLGKKSVEIPEERVQTRHRGERILRTKKVPILNGKGEPFCLLGISEDITEAKLGEEEREKMTVRLQQAQKMEALGALAGGIAHDFNNILSAIMGFTDLARQETQRGTELHDDLSEVLTAGNRARELVQQILTIGRNDAKEIKPIQVGPLIKEALKMLRSTIPSSIEVREDIIDEPLIVQADPTKLHQVIINLATNAKQAMNDGIGVLKVGFDKVSFDSDVKKQYPDMQPGAYARITVSDTGSGISEKDLDKIFEPYFTTKKKGEGTGLGLSVVHGIVKSHQGHITVYSEPGKGTTFQVYLPLVRRVSADSPEPAAKPLPTGTEHILVIDDEPPIVKMQQKAMEYLGYKVTTRTSSLDALEAFRASPDTFDLVVTDMTMPGMTGDDLAREIKEIRFDIPVILCSGFSKKIDDHGKNLDIDGFLMKPVDKRIMANAIRTALDKAKTHDF